MGIYQSVSDQVRSRFTPAEAGSAGRAASAKLMTLHDALKVSLGMVPDWSVLAYWRSSELERGIAAFYDNLSTIVGRRADVWATETTRSEEEVVDALSVADESFPTFAVLVGQIELRPGMPAIAGAGKPRAAVASSAALVAAAEGKSFAQTLARYLSPGIKDFALVEALDVDSYPLRERSPEWGVANSFSKVAGLWFEGGTSWLVSSFCAAVFRELSDDSDEALVARLEAVAEEVRRRK